MVRDSLIWQSFSSKYKGLQKKILKNLAIECMSPLVLNLLTNSDPHNDYENNLDKDIN